VLLESIPGLPQSYLSCAERFGLKGIRFDYFSLWPEAFSGQTLAECLIDAHSERNPFIQRFKIEHLAQIGSWETDPLVVACKNSSFTEGTVLKFNVGNPNAQPTELARSFDTFLLFIGNMDEVASQFEGGNAVAEFKSRLIALGATPEMLLHWNVISEVVFLN
jgi:hypothetical protein